jgi:hypothetical protein
MDHPTSAHRFSIRGWLNGLRDWQFTLALYLLRFAIVLPLGLLLSPFSTSADRFHLTTLDPWYYLLPFVLYAPTLETLIECTLPYSVMYILLKFRPRSPWPFVVAAAMMMVVLHPLTPIVITFAFITGSFLGFVYGHFAHQSQLKAFFHTAIFHAGINIVGWTGIFLQSRT